MPNRGGNAGKPVTLDTVLALCAAPVRREILAALVVSPRSVTDLAGALDLGMSSVSGHLRKLESAGLVRHKTTGNRHVYRLGLRTRARRSGEAIKITIRPDDGSAATIDIPPEIIRRLIRPR